MKLQIKTLNQKSLVIEIEQTKTVYDLKKELSLYSDVGVKPELQKLIYAGKILLNDDELSAYNIDPKKFLVVMILKQPLEEAVGASKSPTTEKASKSPTTEKASSSKGDANAEKTYVSDKTHISGAAQSEFKTPPPPSAGSKKNEDMIQNIISMGYQESEVRRAMAASFNNPERAIEYLTEGIPTSPSTPEGGDSAEDADNTLSPFEVFRRDPLFQSLRSAIHQHPELIDAAIQRVGETNPVLLSLINENQQEFLSMIVSDDEDDDEEDDADSSL